MDGVEDYIEQLGIINRMVGCYVFLSSQCPRLVSLFYLYFHWKNISPPSLSYSSRLCLIKKREGQKGWIILRLLYPTSLSNSIEIYALNPATQLVSNHFSPLEERGKEYSRGERLTISAECTLEPNPLSHRCWQRTANVLSSGLAGPGSAILAQTRTPAGPPLGTRALVGRMSPK